MKPIISIVVCVVSMIHGVSAAATGSALTRLTVLDGSANVIRGVSRAAAVLGMTLHPGDIIESAPDSSLVRMEFADNSLLDLGPGTKLWLGRAAKSASTERTEGYLLDGWAKFSTPHVVALDTRWGVVRTQGSCVIAVSATLVSIFAESGYARLTSKQATTSIASGDYLQITKAGGPPPNAEPPSVTWLKSVPHALKDRVPARRQRFEGELMTPAAGSAPSYSDINHWLQAEPRVRGALITRWRPLLRDSRFQAEVIAQMNLHPEWDRIIFPEKYAPLHRLPVSASPHQPVR